MEFLEQLISEGRVAVPPPPSGEDLRRWSPAEQATLRTALHRLDGLVRLELPPGAPDLSLPAARWGALMLYRGSQFLVHREAGAADVQRTLRLRCPESLSASVLYSVDLTLRYLPDLVTRARSRSPGDPLVAELSSLARAWPLSSVGVRFESSPSASAAEASQVPSQALSAEALRTIAQHPCLRQLYVDRILEQQDTTRIDDVFADDVRIVVGDYPDLCLSASSIVNKVEKDLSE